MKPDHALLITVLSPVLALAATAQNPPAPPPLPSAAYGASTMGAAATYSSRIRTVVYGPQGEVQALALRNGVAVSLPPDLGAQLQTAIVKGSRVQVSGTQESSPGKPACSHRVSRRTARLWSRANLRLRIEELPQRHRLLQDRRGLGDLLPGVALVDHLPHRLQQMA
jgi:hypothetical protein